MASNGHLGHNWMTSTWTKPPIKLEGEALEEVGRFTHLGREVDKLGGPGADVKLKNVWGSSKLPRDHKIGIFNTMVKPVLYGDLKNKGQDHAENPALTNTCLRRIKKVHWPNTISNLELWRPTGQQPVDEKIIWRRWKRVGHTPQDRPSSGTLKGEGRAAGH